MWGIFGKPLKRAIWNTLALHVVLTTCLRFGLFWTMPVLLAASFCHQGATMYAYKFTPRAMHHKSLWCAKGLTLGVQSGCR